MSLYTKSLGLLFVAKGLLNKPSSERVATSARNIIAKVTEELSFREQQDIKEDFLHFVQAPLHNIIVGMLSGIDLYNDLDSSQFNRLVNLSDARLAQVLVKTTIQPPDPQESPIPASDYLFYGAEGFSSLPEEKKIATLRKFFKKSRVSISNLQYLYHNIQKIRDDGKAVLINGEPAEEYVPKMILELISGVEITENSEELVLSRGIFKKKRKKNALSRYFSASKTSYNKIKSGSPEISIRAKQAQLLKNFAFIPHRISDIVKSEIGKYNASRSGVDTEKINLESILSESSVFDFMNQFEYEEGSAVQEELYKNVIANVDEDKFNGYSNEDKINYLEAVFNCLRYSKTPQKALKILRDNLDVVFPYNQQDKEKAEEAVLNRQYEKGWLSPQDETMLGSANYSHQEVQEILNSISDKVKKYSEEPFYKSYSLLEASVDQLQDSKRSRVGGKLLEATILFVETSLRDHYSRDKGEYTNTFVMDQFREVRDQLSEEDVTYFKEKLVGTKKKESWFKIINRELKEARERLEKSQKHPLAIRSVEGYTSTAASDLVVGLNLSPQDVALEAKIRPLIEEQALTNPSFKKQVGLLTKTHSNNYVQALERGDSRDVAKHIKEEIGKSVEKYLLRSEYAFGSILTSATSEVITPLDRSRVQGTTTNFEIQERKAGLYFKADKSTLLEELKTALVTVVEGELEEKDTTAQEIIAVVNGQGIDISSEISRVQEILARNLAYTKKAQMLRDLAFMVKRDQEKPKETDLREIEKKRNALVLLKMANPESRFVEQFLDFLHTSSFLQAEKSISLFSGLNTASHEGKTIEGFNSEMKPNLILTKAQALAKEILNVKAKEALNNPLYLLRKEKAEGLEKAQSDDKTLRKEALAYLIEEKNKEGANNQLIDEYLVLVQSSLDSQINKEDLEAIGLDPDKVLVSEKTARAKRLAKAKYSEAILEMKNAGTLKYVNNYNPTLERKQEEIHEKVLKHISDVIYTRVVSETQKEIDKKVRKGEINKSDNSSVNTFLTEYRRAFGAIEKASLLKAKLGTATFDSALKGTNFLTTMSQKRVLGILAIAEGKKGAFSSMKSNAKSIPALLEIIGASYTNLSNAITEAGDMYKTSPLFENMSQLSDSIRFFHFVLQNHKKLGRYEGQINVDLLEDIDFKAYFGEEIRVLKYFYTSTQDTTSEKFDTIDEMKAHLLETANLKADQKNINTALKKALVAFSSDLAYLIVGGVISPESLSDVEREASDELLALINSTSSDDVSMIRERATEILGKGVSSPAIALTQELSFTFNAMEGNVFDESKVEKKEKILRLVTGQEILDEVEGILASSNISQNSRLANYIVSGDFDLALIELEGKEIFNEIGSALTQMARRAFGKKSLYELIEDMSMGEHYDYFQSLLVDYIRKNLTRLIVGLNAEVDNTASAYDRADNPEIEAKVFSLKANYFNDDILPAYLTQKNLLALDDNRLELSYYLVRLIQQEEGEEEEEG